MTAAPRGAFAARQRSPSSKHPRIASGIASSNPAPAGNGHQWMPRQLIEPPVLVTSRAG